MYSFPYHPVSVVTPFLFQHVQHGVMKGGKKHGGLDLLIEEHAAVHFLQDVHCRHTGTSL